MDWRALAVNSFWVEDPCNRLCAVINIYHDQPPVQARLHDLGDRVSPRALLVCRFPTEPAAVEAIERTVIAHLWAEPGAF